MVRRVNRSKSWQFSSALDIKGGISRTGCSTGAYKKQIVAVLLPIIAHRTYTTTADDEDGDVAAAG